MHLTLQELPSSLYPRAMEEELSWEKCVELPAGRLFVDQDFLFVASDNEKAVYRYNFGGAVEKYDFCFVEAESLRRNAGTSNYPLKIEKLDGMTQILKTDYGCLVQETYRLR